jgi:hypothetical protein
MLAVPAETRRNAWVECPDPNSNALLPPGRSAATSSKKRQLVAGRIQAGTSPAGGLLSW